MLGTIDIEAAATQAAGNWQKFKSFGWFRANELEDAEKWTIVYTNNRDSNLLEQSNAAAIEKALEPFTEGDDPDVVSESHGHWAVGHVDGFSIRVIDSHATITLAFQTYLELQEQLEEYPVLNEEDYSNREYEATLENIDSAAWKLKREFTLPEGWECEVYSWLSDNDPSQVENRDDRGGYPDDDALEAAFIALNYTRIN